MITGAISIIRDITDMRIAELQLYQSHKMDAIGRLAGNINHDFNNILMGIMGYTDVILMEDDIELIKEDVEEIKKAVIKASSLTGQLSELTRKEELVRSNFNVVKTVEGMSKLLDRMVDERINFIIDLPREPCYINADERKIEQSVMNLVINAKEAIFGIGTILLKIRPIEIKRYHQTRFNKIPPGKYVKLIVKDDGNGISNEVLSKIFDPFFSTKSGTGLGLSIIFGAIKQSGGAIEINTDVGLGTEFILYFPLTDIDTRIVKESKKDKAIKWEPRTIFVVDDDSIVLRAVSTMLAYEKNTVFSAVNIDEARLLFDQYKDVIDIVVVDIIMPILNGFQLVAEFKQSRGDIPVIFMTGYSGNHLQEQGISIDDINLLNKPFTKKELLDKINELT
jgi:two-component system cell cycle sensor histidine kinase/response regulator CckA